MVVISVCVCVHVCVCVPPRKGNVELRSSTYASIVFVMIASMCVGGSHNVSVYITTAHDEYTTMLSQHYLWAWWLILQMLCLKCFVVSA